MATKIIFTADEYVKKLIHIALDLPTAYKNVYPQNLGYYHTGGFWSFDCWNLIKAVLWGWEEKRVVGYFQKVNLNTGLGDWTGGKILSVCANQSTDFTKIKKGAFLLTGDKGHAGTYIGEYKYDNHIFNVVECTPIWAGGCQLTYVDEQGRRLRYKGGPQASSWKWHGELPWIDYGTATPQADPNADPFPGVTDEELAERVWLGEFGNGTERQRRLGIRYTKVQALVNSGYGKPSATKEDDSFKVGDTIEVINPVTYTGKKFHLYYDVYNIIEVKGDRAVIGVNGVVTAAININNIRKINPINTTQSEIQVGSKVKVLNAVTYTGHPFYLWYKEYNVLQLIGDRAVIGVNGVITAAINVKNLQKIK